ncbi:MAG: hypothetical protein U9O50_03040 [Acidobacteriota bacterium]|nr:hypothetical protein [Acidobacteriota bacterium]
MSNQKPGMFMPALIGGTVAGLLSGIPLLNCLCCLWIIGGAMLSAYLFSKDSPIVLSAGDGAILGIFSGIIAAVVNSVISIPLHAANLAFIQGLIERVAEYSDEFPSGWETLFERSISEASFPMFMLSLMMSAIIFAALGALGGIIGISIFGKKPKQQNQGVIDVPKDTSDS